MNTTTLDTDQKRKVGRPATGRQPQYSYRMDLETNTLLRRIAERTAEGNESLVIRTMIHEKAAELGITLTPSNKKRAKPTQTAVARPTS